MPNTSDQRHQARQPFTDAIESSIFDATHVASQTHDAPEGDERNSDTDLTQEDLPLLSEPCPVQRTSNRPAKHEGSSFSRQLHSSIGLQDRHQDVQQSPASPVSMHASPLQSDSAHGLNSQQQQKQQQQPQLHIPELETESSSGQMGQLASEAILASSSGHGQVLDGSHNLGSSESQAIQLEDESADDLLEFLADAAAEAPAPIQNQQLHGRCGTLTSLPVALKRLSTLEGDA